MGNKAEFGKVLLRVVRGVERLEQEKICCGDLTLQQFSTMRRIATAERITLGSIAGELGIDLSTASRNLTRLERQGYVCKVRDQLDARTVLLTLTKKGERALTTLYCDERDTLGGVFDRLAPSQRDRVVSSLAALAAALADEDDGTAACCPPEKPEVRRSKD